MKNKLFKLEYLFFNKEIVYNLLSIIKPHKIWFKMDDHNQIFIYEKDNLMLEIKIEDYHLMEIKHTKIYPKKEFKKDLNFKNDYTCIYDISSEFEVITLAKLLEW